MTSNETLEALSRTQIAAALPAAIETALISYRNFMTQENFETPKLFGEHHNACKAAIAHIELLLKLAQWADLKDAPNANDTLKEILKRAENEIKTTTGLDDE